MKTAQVKDFQDKLLCWYDRHARELPWRFHPTRRPIGEGGHEQGANPYHVWLSEIMLQQTTIATVKDYFLKFIATWPTLHDLADATEDEVLAAWSGLGYYSRARNLHKAARQMIADFKGVVPDNYDDLKSLSGVGDYTASAVSAIAYNKQATVMDGNIERVVSRVFEIQEKLPKSKPIYREKTDILAQNPMIKKEAIARHGDYAQAMMDLGATICTPTSPKCLLCPVNDLCGAYKVGEQASYPKKEKKKKSPEKYADAFVIFDKQGRIFMRKRPETGLLANLYEVPSTQWLTGKKHDKDVIHPFNASWTNHKPNVRHVFTHFGFNIRVHSTVLGNKAIKAQSLLNLGVWIEFNNIGDYGVPTLMKKIILKAYE